jgi:hypothetical protein
MIFEGIIQNTVHKDVMENVGNSIQVPAEIHLGPKNA